MARFASETNVSAERSRAEIEETLRRYGAAEFQTGWKVNAAMIGFRKDSFYVRFILPFPDRAARRFTHRKVRGVEVKASELQRERSYEQEVRQRWRALLLVVKAKLEAVECGISTFTEEFLAHIVCPDDRSVMEWMTQDFLPAIQAGRMPALMLPAPRPDPPGPE